MRVVNSSISHYNPCMHLQKIVNDSYAKMEKSIETLKLLLNMLPE